MRGRVGSHESQLAFAVSAADVSFLARASSLASLASAMAVPLSGAAVASAAVAAAASFGLAAATGTASAAALSAATAAADSGAAVAAGGGVAPVPKGSSHISKRRGTCAEARVSACTGGPACVPETLVAHTGL